MNLFIVRGTLSRSANKADHIQALPFFLGSDLEPGRPHISSEFVPTVWNIPYGALAQLGEHLLCKQGVIGSIPIRSTKAGSVAQLVRAHP